MTEAILRGLGYRPVSEATEGVTVEGYHNLSPTHRHNIGFCYLDRGVWIDSITSRPCKCQPTHFRPIHRESGPNF